MRKLAFRLWVDLILLVTSILLLGLSLRDLAGWVAHRKDIESWQEITKPMNPGISTILLILAVAMAGLSLYGMSGHMKERHSLR